MTKEPFSFILYFELETTLVELTSQEMVGFGAPIVSHGIVAARSK